MWKRDQQSLFEPDTNKMMNIKSKSKNESKYESKDQGAVNNDASIGKTANPKKGVQVDGISLIKTSSLDQLQHENNKEYECFIRGNLSK